ncbi:hypothetical protein P154DRAFT_452113 [Amniculicola lignicola CBS 123094]|uniref:C2H2-type domain-containing protein n=1 Tax=Amniculicola lignicola CBS 123094 TaxID=1392246 RepID=A0A6A5VTN1_9PLEO|nr:hypothetical protein P154DRAFT_452113 [Amniculicola lignicola CBS 123094]
MNGLVADDDGWEQVGKPQNKTKPTVKVGHENRRPPQHAKEFPALKIVNGTSANGRPRFKPAIDWVRESRQAGPVQGQASEHQDGTPPRSSIKNFCGICHLQCQSKATIVVHVKEFGHEHYCNLCTRVFVDRNGLRNHVENSAGHEHVCNLCLSAFLDVNGLRNHLQNANNHRFACAICLVGFKSQQDLVQHHATAAKHILCRTCHRKFPNQKERDEHWKKTNKHKHCLMPGCEYDSSNIRLLNKHLRESHHMCSGCEKLFQSQTKLHAHLGTCLASKERDSGLDAAPMLLSTPMGPPPHGMSVHPPQQPLPQVPCSYSCWLCERAMPNASGLIKHLESGNCKMFPDPAVLMTFLGKWWYSVLYMDIGIHVQIRTERVVVKELIKWGQEGIFFPFVCRGEDCGQVFGTLSALAAHIESQACPWEIWKLGLDKMKRDLELKMALDGSIKLPS